jgi:beta-N-acetylglucosaminidase
MVVMAPRESWTDERLDDLKEHMDARFDAQQRHMDARFDDLNRTMQIGFTLIGVVLAALIGLIATQL